MTSDTRAQRLIDEFEEGASLDFGKGFSFRHGIAAVLRHLVGTEAEDVSWGAVVSARTLEDLADALEAPTLLERAMAGRLSDRLAGVAGQFARPVLLRDQDGLCVLHERHGPRDRAALPL